MNTLLRGLSGFFFIMGIVYAVYHPHLAPSYVFFSYWLLPLEVRQRETVSD